LEFEYDRNRWLEHLQQAAAETYFSSDSNFTDVPAAKENP